MVAVPGATRHGHTVFAKNSDRPKDECQPLELHARKSHAPGSTVRCTFIAVPQAETTWRHVGSRPWWCWGYEHGFNEHQVVIGNEAVHSKLDPAPDPNLIGMDLVRLGLERGRTAREAVGEITQLISEFGQGKFAQHADLLYDNGYIVADPTEAFVIETAGHEWAVERVGDALGISNVYSVEAGYSRLSESAEALAVANGWWTEREAFNFADAFTKESRVVGSGARRRTRSCSVLGNAVGQIDVHTMMSLLSDHSDATVPEEPFQTEINPGHGICTHFDYDEQGNMTSGNTAASLIADLCGDESRLPVYWCSFYSPCLSLFFPVFIEAELPEVLACGSEQSDDESPWWRVHCLNAAVRDAGSGAATLVRGQWSGLQESLITSADEHAVEAKELIENGNELDAKTMLTRYVEDNVNAMLKTVDELNDAVRK
jgi:dipeptidase